MRTRALQLIGPEIICSISLALRLASHVGTPWRERQQHQVLDIRPNGGFRPQGSQRLPFDVGDVLSLWVAARNHRRPFSQKYTPRFGFSDALDEHVRSGRELAQGAGA